MNTDICALEWDTLWSAVSAIATVIGVIAVIVARQELHFAGWLKAQEVFTDERFTQARSELFKRLDMPETDWKPEEIENALKVCRKMEELAALAPYFSKKVILREWGPSIAKAWFLVERIVKAEREKTKWPQKWHAFQELGQEATEKFAEMLPPKKTKE